MPLGSYFTGQWYGEAAGATRGGEASAVVAAAVVARGQAGGALSGVAAIPNARATRLVSRPATLVGVALITDALPKARARVASTIRVNTLSQDDVTGAVLETQIEPGVTLKEAMRLALAVLAGKSSVSGGTVTFRDLNDDLARVTATVNSSGERTAVTLNAADA